MKTIEKHFISLLEELGLSPSEAHLATHAGLIDEPLSQTYALDPKTPLDKISHEHLCFYWGAVIACVRSYVNKKDLYQKMYEIFEDKAKFSPFHHGIPKTAREWVLHELIKTGIPAAHAMHIMGLLGDRDDWSMEMNEANEPFIRQAFHESKDVIRQYLRGQFMPTRIIEQFTDDRV